MDAARTIVEPRLRNYRHLCGDVGSPDITSLRTLEYQRHLVHQVVSSLPEPTSEVDSLAVMRQIDLLAVTLQDLGHPKTSPPNLDLGMMKTIPCLINMVIHGGDHHGSDELRKTAEHVRDTERMHASSAYRNLPLPFAKEINVKHFQQIHPAAIRDRISSFYLHQIPDLQRTHFGTALRVFSMFLMNAAALGVIGCSDASIGALLQDFTIESNVRRQGLVPASRK